MSTKARTCPKCGIKNPAKKESKAAILLVLLAIIAFFVFGSKNDFLDHTRGVPANQIAPTIEHAEQQIAEAMKDPDKVRLMECMGVDPWKETPKPAGWTPPTMEECLAVSQKLGTAAGQSKEAIESVQKEITINSMPADGHTTDSPKIGRDGLAGGSADDKWQEVQSYGREIFVKTNGYYSGGTFSTYIVSNLPESDIVGAPQSVMTMIEGDCSARTFHIVGALYFAGKNRSGMAVDNAPPENVVRKLTPGSPFEAAFNLLCKNTETSE